MQSLRRTNDVHSDRVGQAGSGRLPGMGRNEKRGAEVCPGQALHYLLEQWLRLIRYLNDGRLEISNNFAERSKPFVMGQKNFLFANTPSGAKGSATIFSLISARENELMPFEYLTKVFTQAPNGANSKALMPWST